MFKNKPIFEDLTRELSKEELQILMETPHLIIDVLEGYDANEEMDNVQEELDDNKDESVDSDDAEKKSKTNVPKAPEINSMNKKIDI